MLLLLLSLLLASNPNVGGAAALTFNNNENPDHIEVADDPVSEEGSSIILSQDSDRRDLGPDMEADKNGGTMTYAGAVNNNVSLPSPSEQQTVGATSPATSSQPSQPSLTTVPPTPDHLHCDHLGVLPQ